MRIRKPGRVATVLLALAVSMAGCGRDKEASQADRPPEMAHIHGLGVDPADSAVYVATHYGLFRLDSTGRPARVGKGRQDTMGFTVVGPRRFLGSGHPDQAGQSFRRIGAEPPLLGLIDSSDAGQTWRGISLKGEADFHTLLAAHGRIYGWNSTSGEVMVSTDEGASWGRRATLNLLSFAVDPADPEHLLGSSDKGLVVSRDGGRTWQPAPPGGPGPGLLAWDRDGGLWAAQLDGVVLTSTDAGHAWQPRAALPGKAAALLATKGAVYAATANERVLRSDDNGRTWTVLYAPAE